MWIFLLILKWIFIILGILLGLVLLFTSLVLCVPVRYRAAGDNREKIQYSFKVSWLLSVVAVKKKKDSEQIVFSVFGIPIKRMGNEKPVKKNVVKSDIQKRKTNHKKKLAGISLAALLIGTAAAVSGCSGPSLPSLGGKYVFKVGSEKCPEKEAKIILLNYQKDYSSLYGIDMWSGEYEDGNSLEDYVKDLTVSQLAEVYTLDIIAGEQEIALSEEETAETEAAAKEFMEGLDDAEREYLGASEGDVQNLYERYLLARKLYTSLTESVSSEVSDDEARVMDLKQICVSDENTAEQIAAQAASGADFSTLAAASFEENFKTPSALFTSIPRIMSATRRILRGEVGTFCNFAKYMVLRASFLFSADIFFLAPIILLLYYFR